MWKVASSREHVAPPPAKNGIQTFSVSGDAARAIPGPSLAAGESGGEDDNDIENETGRTGYLGH